MTYEATSIVNAILIAFLGPAALCFALWFVIWLEQMVPGELRAKAAQSVNRATQVAYRIGRVVVEQTTGRGRTKGTEVPVNWSGRRARPAKTPESFGFSRLQLYGRTCTADPRRHLQVC